MWLAIDDLVRFAQNKDQDFNNITTLLKHQSTRIRHSTDHNADGQKMTGLTDLFLPLMTLLPLLPFVPAGLLFLVVHHLIEISSVPEASRVSAVPRPEYSLEPRQALSVLKF